MCQLTFSNFHDDTLNQKFFTIASMLGSPQNRHGWGFLGTFNCSWSKSFLQANLTLNIGEHLKLASGPLMGHIRQASTQVPVTDENAHPFTKQDIFQFHNGNLTPKEESKFTISYEVKETDEKGITSVRRYKHSDSKIFFEYFMSILELNRGEFIKSIQQAMKEFYGKFALMYFFSQSKERYIIRGKTADLYISYIKESNEKDAKTTGYAINTSSEVLDTSLILLSNLQQLEGKGRIYFTSAQKLKEETIFLAKEFGLEEVGELKEETYYTTKHSGYSNFKNNDDYSNWFLGNKNGADPINYASESSIVFARYLFNFMEDYSMTWQEIQYLFYLSYGLSILEGTTIVFEHFQRVLESLKSKTNPAIKKQIKNACKSGQIPSSVYHKFTFPWMLNPKAKQIEMAKEIRKVK